MIETSVLLPAYNAEKYISQCIKSILAQDYKNYEIIIIDDNSTDHTADIIKSIKDERILYIRNKRNLGIVGSLNSGLRLAKGEFISRMDADDVMLGNRLKEQTEFLKIHPEVGMVGSHYLLITDFGRIIGTHLVSIDPDFLKFNLLFRNQFAHSSISIRKSLLLKLKYRSKYLYNEDYDLWCRVAKVTKIANLEALHLAYRLHSTNTCSLNQQVLKTNVISLLSGQLKKMGIKHSVDDLRIHAAICFGYGIKYFNTDEKKNQLITWLDKIFNHSALKNYNSRDLSYYRQYVLEHYCGFVVDANASE